MQKQQGKRYSVAGGQRHDQDGQPTRRPLCLHLCVDHLLSISMPSKGRQVFAQSIRESLSLIPNTTKT